MSLKTLNVLKGKAFLGGIGTGCLKFAKDASNEFCGLVKSTNRNDSDKTPANVNPISFFAGVKFDAQEDFYATALGSCYKDISPSAKMYEYKNSFPFTEAKYRTVALKGIDISLCAFNPTVVHNPIDSAIPAAFFEFSVKNNTDKMALFTLCTAMKSFFSAGKEEFGYDVQTSSAYAVLSEASKSVSARRRGSLCVATDNDNFTYESLPYIDDRDFFKRFCHLKGFLTDSAFPREQQTFKNISSMLSCHANIAPGGVVKFRVIVSWCFSNVAEVTTKDSEKNYYYHYFPDVLSCATYCIKHFDRLKKECLLTKELVSGGSLNHDVKMMLSNLLGCIKNPFIRRDSKGVIYGIGDCDYEKSTSAVSFALEYLFPTVTAKSAQQALKELICARGKLPDSDEFAPTAYDTDCSMSQIYSRLMLILRLYMSYKNHSELKFFSENWVDISYMASILCRLVQKKSIKSENDVPVYSVLACSMKAMLEVADHLCDKKRKILFLDMYTATCRELSEYAKENAGEACVEILNGEFLARQLCATSIFNKEVVSVAAKSAKKLTNNVDFLTCAMLEMCGQTKNSMRLAREYFKSRTYNSEYELYEKAMQCAFFIPVFSGFEYDKNTMTIRFSPDEKYCDDDGTFKGFISFDGAYGIVEQGIDYIEIKLLYGEIRVRNFICSHRPYKAMYAGRLWNYDIHGNKVVFDNNLNVTKDKKLTLLIDITK